MFCINMNTYFIILLHIFLMFYSEMIMYVYHMTSPWGVKKVHALKSIILTHLAYTANGNKL